MGIFGDFKKMMKKAEYEKKCKELEAAKQPRTNNALSEAEFNGKRAKLRQDRETFVMEQDNRKNTITETFYNDPEAYGYNDVEGPWDETLDEEWYVKPAIEYDLAMKTPLGLLRWMQKKRSKQLDAMFCNDKLDWFITDIFLANAQDVNHISTILRNKHPELFSDALTLKGNEYMLNELAYNRILYKCMATDIVCGNIPDKYKLYDEKLDQTYCRKLLNEFPVHGNAQTKDGRTLNVAVAFWISYNALSYKRIIKEPLDWTKLYNLLLNKLGYSGVEMLDIQTTAFTSGVSGRFFKKEFGESVYKKCKANKAATRFINLIKYILINSDLVDKEVEVYTCIENKEPEQIIRGRRIVNDYYSKTIGYVRYKFSKQLYRVEIERKE